MNPPQTQIDFDFSLFLAHIERADGPEMLASFQAAMKNAGITDADRDNMTPEAASNLLAQARAKHAARSS